MSSTTHLTDAALEAMLAQRAARPDRPELREGLVAAIEATPQVRRPIIQLPERPAWTQVAAPPAWAFIAVAVLIAVVAAVVGAQLLDDTRREVTPLAPTGVEVLRPEGGEGGQVVIDGRGVAWTYDEGTLARLAQSPAAIATWTFTDDAAFADVDRIAPSQGRGVWLIGSSSVRLFDGQRFYDVSPKGFSSGSDFGGATAEGEHRGIVLAEGPNGDPFAVSPSGVFRWDGEGWTAPPGLPPDAMAGFGARTIVSDPRDGSVWVANVGPQQRDLARYDGSGWTSYRDVLPVGAGGGGRYGAVVRAMAFARDGDLWLAGELGVAVFDGAIVRGEAVAGVTAPSSIAVGGDGGVWVAGADATDPGQVVVARSDGRSWRVYGAADGLPAAAAARPATVAARSAAYVATEAGVYRLTAGRWERVWPMGTPGPRGVSALLADSGEKVWAVGVDPAGGVRGLWRYADGAWQREVGPAAEILDLARMADGALLAATADGVYALRGGDWSLVWTGPALKLTVGVDGRAFVAWVEADADGQYVWHVATFDPAHPGSAEPAIADPPTREIADLVADADGSLWTASAAWEWGWSWGEVYLSTEGVARYDDGRWSIVGDGESEADRALRRELDAPQAPLGRVAAAPDGAVWAVWSWGDTVRVGSFDGTRWELEDPGLEPLPIASARALAVGGDGTVWLATDTTAVGLACRTDAGWTTIATGADFGPAIAAAADGSVVVMTPGGVGRVPRCGG